MRWKSKLMKLCCVAELATVITNTGQAIYALDFILVIIIVVYCRESRISADYLILNGSDV